MSPLHKCAFYTFLVLFAAAGLVLEQNFDTRVGTWMWRIGASLIPLALAIMEWVVPSHDIVKAKRANACRTALDRIEKKRSNFAQIQEAQRTGRQLTGAHHDAVAVTSYRLTEEAMRPLRRYWKYWRPVNAALREIKRNRGKRLDAMRVGRLIQILSGLAKKLQKEVGNA